MKMLGNHGGRRDNRGKAWREEGRKTVQMPPNWIIPQTTFLAHLLSDLLPRISVFLPKSFHAFIVQREMAQPINQTWKQFVIYVRGCAFS